MHRRWLIFLPLLFVGMTTASNARAQNDPYQVEVRGLAEEILQDIQRAGLRRAEFKVTKQGANSKVNQLFEQEITDQFINVGRRYRMTVLQKSIWNTLDDQQKDGNRYRPDTLPRTGQTLAAVDQIDISIIKVSTNQYRVGVRVSNIESGQGLIAGSRTIQPPPGVNDNGHIQI